MSDPRVSRSVPLFLDAADSLLESVDYQERQVIFCGARVLVRTPAFARSDGIDVLDAFIPAQNQDETADWVIDFVAPQAGVKMPEGMWPSDWHYPLGTLDYAKTSPFHVALDRHTGAVTVLDPLSRRAAVWVADLETFPYWAAATPFRLVFSWIASYYDAELLHGASVGLGGTAILLVGPSGAGKSTAAFLARSRGFWLQGDDFVTYFQGNIEPLYRRAKIHDDSLAKMSHLGLTVLNPDTPNQKRIIALDGLGLGDGTPDSAALAGLVVPVRDPSSSKPLGSRGQLLAALAPHSLSGVLGGLPGSLSRIARIVRSVPGFQWNLTWEIERDLDELETLWGQLS